MQNNAKKDKKRAARANLFFLLIRKKSVLQVQFVFLLIRSIDLDAIFHCPPCLALQDLIFFVLLTRASLLALTKSIYYFRLHGYRNNFHFPFCLYWLLKSSLASQRVAMRFPAEKTLSFWIAIPLVRVILHWYAYGADGRSHSHVTTSCYKSLWDA